MFVTVANIIICLILQILAILNRFYMFLYIIITNVAKYKNHLKDFHQSIFYCAPSFLSLPFPSPDTPCEKGNTHEKEGIFFPIRSLIRKRRMGNTENAVTEHMLEIVVRASFALI